MSVTLEYVSPRYLSSAETAKLVRVQLRQEFPGVKFSVRSSSYAGGASIQVGWTDGPTDGQVEKVARIYSGADFDGMVDLKTGNTHWLMPDGTVAVAHSGGQGSTREEIVGSAPHPSAELVRLGSDYVFCQRETSQEWRAAILRLFGRMLGRDLGSPTDFAAMDALVPLAVDWSHGKLYHMVEAETERVGTVMHQFAAYRQGGCVDTGEVAGEVA